MAVDDSENDDNQEGAIANAAAKTTAPVLTDLEIEKLIKAIEALDLNDNKEVAEFAKRTSTNQVLATVVNTVTRTNAEPKVDCKVASNSTLMLVAVIAANSFGQNHDSTSCHACVSEGDITAKNTPIPQNLKSVVKNLRNQNRGVEKRFNHRHDDLVDRVEKLEGDLMNLKAVVEGRRPWL
ncbi:hypothetical protein ACHAQA_008835 [Verticillium albo-atrum]